MHITVCKTCWRKRGERWKYGTSVLWMIGEMDCLEGGQLKTKEVPLRQCPLQLEHSVYANRLTVDHFRLVCLFFVAFPILLICFLFAWFCHLVKKFAGWLEQLEDKLETVLNEI